MFARIGIMRALNRHVERVFNPDRKDHHWGRRNWRGIDDQVTKPLALPMRVRGLGLAPRLGSFFLNPK